MYICLCLRVLPIRMKNLSGPGAEHTPASPDATGIRQTDTPREDSEPIHLILIDDDRIQLQLTTAMLERPGVTVTCCHHPEELLNQLKEKRFDVLLTGHTNACHERIRLIESHPHAGHIMGANPAGDRPDRP